MTTKKYTCSQCGHGQDISTTADLSFEICQGCSEMGEWGQSEAIEAEVVEEVESMLPAELETLTAMELFDPDKIKTVVNFVIEKARAHKPDISTAKGRAAIASNAAQVSRSKTWLESIGKPASAKIKAEAKTLDASRKFMKDTLDSLRDETRKPLTEWEAAEKVREAAEQLAEEIAIAYDAAIAEDNIFNREREIKRKEVKFAKDEEDRLAKAAEEKRLKEEKAKEEELKAKAKEEAAKDAAQKILDAEERTKKAEAEREEAAKKAEADKNEAVAKAIKDGEEKAAKAERERLAEEERKRLEDEKRAADTKHRAGINQAIIDHLVGSYSLDEMIAKSIVYEIEEGNIPHTTINY